MIAQFPLKTSPFQLRQFVSLVTTSFFFSLGWSYPSTAVANRFHPIERCFLLIVFDSNDEFVNLRETPNGSIIRPLANGTEVVRPGEPALIDGNWTEVRLGGLGTEGDQGYVFSELLHRAIYQVQDPDDQTVNFRETPNGKIIKPLVNGTEVAFVAETGEWTKVRLLSGEEGYIFSRLLRNPSCF
jgi:hypothetical protein